MPGGSMEVWVARSRSNGVEPEYAEIGDRLRVARAARGLSLRSLADRLGVSPSLISQVERGRAKPSVSTLYAIVNELGISLDELLFPDVRQTGRGGGPDGVAAAPNRPPATPSTPSTPATPATVAAAVREALDIELPAEPVQRAASRQTIRLASGVVWERLTSASIPNVDFFYVTYEVGGASSPENEFQRHAGQEWGYVLSGVLGVRIAFDEYVLRAGDAIAFDSTTPHRLFNAADEPVHGIWFVLGRRGEGSADERAARSSGVQITRG